MRTSPSANVHKRRRIWREPVTREDLSSLAFFRGLESADLDAIIDVAEGVHYAEGQEVVTHGDSSRDVYFVLAGTIRVNMFSPAGRHITFELLDAGQMFGELAAIDGINRSASCVAETDVFVARMSAETYRDILRRTPDLAEASLRRLASLVRSLTGKVYESHALQVPQRVRRELLRIAEAAAPTGNTVEVTPGPQDSDIASRIGTTREAVNREIAGLGHLGLVRREQSRTLRFLDIDALRAMVEETEC